MRKYSYISFPGDEGGGDSGSSGGDWGGGGDSGGDSPMSGFWANLPGMFGSAFNLISTNMASSQNAASQNQIAALNANSSSLATMAQIRLAEQQKEQQKSNIIMAIIGGTVVITAISIFAMAKK